jgi:hypothetical protein
MQSLSFPSIQLPRIALPKVRRFWVYTPVAVIAVSVAGGILLAQKPTTAQATQRWVATAAAAEYVSSDPSLPAASTVKFPEDYSEPAPTF